MESLGAHRAERSGHMSSSASTPSPPDPPPDATARPCPRCHQPIPPGAAHGLCPACLLAAGLFTRSDPDARDASDAPPPSPEELAPEFPALEIIELLGRGGMGAVYKARQRHLDRLVALKLLRPGLDSDPSFAERFTREARALAQLNHPGIVTLHEFGHTPADRYFIVMEFVDGVNLRQLLAAGRLAPREALAIVPPLCDALQYAHDHGLVHRDIKPENILVDRLGRVKIADFGLAKLVSAESDTGIPACAPSSENPSSTPAAHLTEAGRVMGTPRYMSPEQRDQPAAVDHRADIYALGVVLYQMLTGELPDEKQLQPPSRRVRIDVRLDEIVLRALEKDPALRYAAASEFKTRVEDFAAAAPAPPTGSPVLPTKAPTRGKAARRQTLALAFLTLLALALSAAWIRERRESTTQPVLTPAEPVSAPPQGASRIQVHVFGAVQRPGVYPLRHDASLLDALAAAGGWTRAADWSAIRIDGPAPAQTGDHHLGDILEGDAINPRLSEGATVFLPSRSH